MPTTFRYVGTLYKVSTGEEKAFTWITLTQLTRMIKGMVDGDSITVQCQEDYDGLTGEVV